MRFEWYIFLAPPSFTLTRMVGTGLSLPVGFVTQCAAVTRVLGVINVAVQAALSLAIWTTEGCVSSPIFCPLTTLVIEVVPSGLFNGRPQEAISNSIEPKKTDLGSNGMIRFLIKMAPSMESLFGKFFIIIPDILLISFQRVMANSRTIGKGQKGIKLRINLAFT